MNIIQRNARAKASLVDVISNWYIDQQENTEGFVCLSDENLTGHMADAALAVLLAIEENQKWLEENSEMK